MKKIKVVFSSTGGIIINRVLKFKTLPRIGEKIQFMNVSSSGSSASLDEYTVTEIKHKDETNTNRFRVSMKGELVV